jgi:hypothetical protein
MNLYKTLLGVASRQRPNAVPAERAQEYEQLKSTLGRELSQHKEGRREPSTLPKY